LEKGEERTDLITLVDDDGNEHDFAVLDIFSLNMRQYAILVPISYDEENDEEEDLNEEAYIFRVEIDEASGEETMVEVEDEAEWNQVAREWESRAQNDDQEDEEDLF